MKKTPVKTYRAGGIKADIWSNSQGKNKQTAFSVTIKKQHRDSNGDWKDTATFFSRDLADLQAVADSAYRFIRLKGRDDD